MSKQESQYKQTLLNKVTKLLDENTDVQSTFFGSEFNEEYSRWEDKETTAFRSALIAEGITAKHEDNHGGEGEGDRYWSVYSFTDESGAKIFIQFDGYYASYVGSEYDTYFEVKPKEVLVTQYFRV